MGEVAVLIPTLRRPESLDRTLRSLAAQSGAKALIEAVVVVDNSPEGSARPVAESWSPALPILYVHEPRPGVATARNAGLAKVAADYVAFLDDDEEAPPSWLETLLGVHKAFGADVTFGPWRGQASAAPAWKRPYLDAFFSRTGPERSGLTDQRYGCGNSLMTRATTLSGPAPFDPAYDQTGGEDDRLYQALTRRGARFAWAAEAWVWEHAPDHRCRIAYTLRRAFSFGQTPTTDCAHQGDWPGVLRWMAIGAAQTAIYGAAAAVLWATGSARRLAMTDRAVRGLGKVIWWVTPKFYGQAEVARSA
ncbi:MAG TPA: glycosyltransferase [Caulobacteraceae bacterium]|jgi:glycosyltransferase involved in cell wall biosynthesis|nr:glycosyltransferase [Caulobacteraceae bacterium]